MPDEKESAATRATRRALEFQWRMRERIDKDISASIGYEGVSTKAIRSLIRRAIEGDEAAQSQLDYLERVEIEAGGTAERLNEEADYVLKNG